jgi:hypothetical protein
LKMCDYFCIYIFLLLTGAAHWFLSLCKYSERNSPLFILLPD